MKKLLLIIVLSLFLCGSVWGATKYVDNDCTNAITTYNPAGDACTGGSDTVYSSILNGIAAMSAGDTLYVQDDTYTERIVVASKTGTSGSQYTIKAYNDGKAIIDYNPVGELSLLSMSGSSYINIEGFVFLNNAGDAVETAYIETSDHINIKRCSVYVTARDVDKVAWYVGATSSYVLVEDCSVIGRFPKGISVQGDGDNITLRRNYIHRYGWTGSADDTNALIETYGGDSTVMENNVVRLTETTGTDGTGAYIIWRNMTTTSCDDILYYGNIAVDIIDAGGARGAGYDSAGAKDHVTGTQYINNVCINCEQAFMAVSTGPIFTNNTFVELVGVSTSDLKGECSVACATNCNDCNADIDATLTNNSFSGSGISITPGTLSIYTTTGNGTNCGAACEPATDLNTFELLYNNFYNGTVIQTGALIDRYTVNTGNYCGGASEITCANSPIDPAYDTTTYGDGAYLFVPAALKGKGASGADIGAQVMYRYTDGVVGTTHLWPWPMESRIKAETTSYISIPVSVTYENDGDVPAGTGGIWKTPSALGTAYSGLEGVTTTTTSVSSQNTFYLDTTGTAVTRVAATASSCAACVGSPGTCFSIAGLDGAVLNEGDTIKACAGTYESAFSISTDGITFEADTGATAIFDMAANTDAGADEGIYANGIDGVTIRNITLLNNDINNIYCVNCTNWTIDGVTSTNADTRYGILFSGASTGNTITDCTVEDNACGGIGFIGTGHSNNTVTGCMVTDNGIAGNCSGILINDSAVVSTGNSISENTVTGNSLCGIYGGNFAGTISQNNIYGNQLIAGGGYAGIDLRGASGTPIAATVSYNYIHDVTDADNTFPGIYVTYPSGTAINGNVIDTIADAGADDADGIVIDHSVAGTNVIYNNTIYNVEGDGIVVTNSAAGGTLAIKNNIIEEFSNAGYGINVDAASDDAALTITDYNCIYDAGGGDYAYWGDAASATLQDYKDDAGAGTNGDHSYQSDPLLNAPAAGDFTIASASGPCDDAGANLGATYKWAFHHNDITWPFALADQGNFGTAWDIGAYVFKNPSTQNKKLLLRK